MQQQNARHLGRVALGDAEGGDRDVDLSERGELACRHTQTPAELKRWRVGRLYRGWSSLYMAVISPAATEEMGCKVG